MSYQFHCGRDARYTGAATIPRVGGVQRPAAALVVQHPRLKVRVDPMYRALDSCPSEQPVEAVHLVPVSFVDFYARCANEEGR